jgi:hypothetical protein
VPRTWKQCLTHYYRYRDACPVCAQEIAARKERRAAARRARKGWIAPKAAKKVMQARARMRASQRPKQPKDA